VSTFSHSRIAAFETCPKKYEFTYIIKAPKGPDGIESFTGSRVHEALEWLYGQVRLCRAPSEQDVVDRFHAGWEEEWDESVRVTRSDRTADDFRQIGEKALRDYHRRYQPFDQGVTVGLESRIAVHLDKQHEIVGYIDRLTKVSDGVWEIHDYKTSNKLMTQQDADSDRQLALYALAVREMYPDAVDVSLVWHYLAFDHEVRSRRSPEQLDELKQQVLGSIREIEAHSEFPTKVSNLCGWCDHQQSCPAWSHKFEIEAPEKSPQAAGESVAVDGAALVDEYIEVSAKMGELKARQEELRDAIVAFANARALERVFGASGALKVFRFPQVSIPDAKDPSRLELERALRELGLIDRFSALSGYQLSRGIQEGALNDEQLAAIEPYLERSQGVRLYASRTSS
jgi:putative RecB family exonuclease